MTPLSTATDLCAVCGQRFLSATCPHEEKRPHLDIEWSETDVRKGESIIHPHTTRTLPRHCYRCCPSRREVR